MTTPRASDSDRLAAHLQWIGRLLEVHRRLRLCATVEELLAAAAESACEECGFERGLVLSLVEPGRLTADETGVLSDPASDRMRRRALQGPIELVPGTAEAEIVRRSEHPGRHRITAGSELASALGLKNFALGVIAPESRPLALLVVDRDHPPVDTLDRADVAGFAAVLGVGLEQMVLRARVAELSAELRQLSTSTQAMVSELLDSPVSLPSRRAGGSAFARVDVAQPEASPDRVRELLSERETKIAELLAEGLSNREIADRLVVSPETVKSHVAHILRKFHASNRVEAVTRYLRLVGGADAG